MPEFKTQQMSPFITRFYRDSFVEAGQESYYSPPSQNPDAFEIYENVLPAVGRDLKRRWGNAQWNGTATALTSTRRMWHYMNVVGGARRIVANAFPGTHKIVSFTEAGVNANTGVFTITGTPANVHMGLSRGTAYFASGDVNDLLWWDGADGTTASKIGIPAPVYGGTTATPVASGAITLEVGREYANCFKNSTTGHLGPPTIIVGVGPLVSQNVDLVAMPAAPAGWGIDKRIILCTRDGGSREELIFLAEIDSGTTTYTDNLPETTEDGTISVTTNAIYAQVEDGQEFGVHDNTSPRVAGHGANTGQFMTPHKGRMFLLVGTDLYFSKSLSEVTTSDGVPRGRPEECWPGDYSLPISAKPETGKGLLSDGNILYIGTERNIHRLLGSGPEDFEKPEILHAEVGIINQDCWQIVFQEGAPAGVIWMTPDLRVIFSDFNTYKDIGEPIQDLLNTINTGAVDTIHAKFVAKGPHVFYTLGIPTGANTSPNLFCIFDLKKQRWIIWKTAVANPAFGAQIYFLDASGIPQWVTAMNTNAYAWGSAYTDDAGTGITTKLQTTWLDFGTLSHKALNEINIITGSSGTTCTVVGANTAVQFASPVTIVSALGFAASQTLGDFRLSLAGKVTKYRYYRFLLQSTATAADVLQYLSVDVKPASGL